MANKRILVVDDEPVVLELTGRMLAHLGYEADMYLEGADALERFLNDPDGIDLVISDVRMPEISGEVLARRIHQTRPDIPIILCSGLYGPKEDLTGEEKNAHTVLSKPIRLRELEVAVQSALNPDGNSGPSC